MSATVTDITEYRTSKRTQEAAAIVYFSDWTDKRIESRYVLLSHIRDGQDELTDPDNDLVRMAFPNGFDPVYHLGDNIDAVYQEGVRRGVFVTSE